MVAYAILRCSKLKSMGEIGGSLSHTYRTRNTPNADPERFKNNSYDVEKKSLLEAIEKRLPDKRRKDAVLCIEHLITASPQWSGWGTEKEHQFFETARDWLEKRYGSSNVISCIVHRDETTPYMVAYVVPLDEATGRLNAKKWLGSRAILRMMQTNFAETVKSFGLERGLEGSKAEHTTVKEYYSRLNKIQEIQEEYFDFSKVVLPQKSFLESSDSYAQRVFQVAIDFFQEEKDRLLKENKKIVDSKYKVLNKLGKDVFSVQRAKLFLEYIGISKDYDLFNRLEDKISRLKEDQENAIKFAEYLKQQKIVEAERARKLELELQQVQRDHEQNLKPKENLYIPPSPKPKSRSNDDYSPGF